MLFGGCDETPAHLYDQKIPNTPILGLIDLSTWIGIFKLNWLNVKPALSKPLHPFQQNLNDDKDHQILFVGGPNTHTTNPRWRTNATLKLFNCHIWAMVQTIATMFGMVMHLIKLQSYKNKTGFSLFVVKATALKYQISKFYSQILSTKAAFCDRPLTDIMWSLASVHWICR